MFIFILASISDGIKTEDPLRRKLLANSNQTSAAACATRGSACEISRQRSGRTSNSLGKPFSRIKRERNGNLQRPLADPSESNQRQTLIYLELSVDTSPLNTWILKLSEIDHRLLQKSLSIKLNTQTFILAIDYFDFIRYTQGISFYISDSIVS